MSKQRIHPHCCRPGTCFLVETLTYSQPSLCLGSIPGGKESSGSDSYPDCKSTQHPGSLLQTAYPQGQIARRRKAACRGPRHISASVSAGVFKALVISQLQQGFYKVLGVGRMTEKGLTESGSKRICEDVLSKSWNINRLTRDGS